MVHVSFCSCTNALFPQLMTSFRLLLCSQSEIVGPGFPLLHMSSTSVSQACKQADSSACLGINESSSVTSNNLDIF